MIVAAAILMAGCSSQPTPSDLWKTPEAGLIYPGSATIQKNETEAKMTIEGRQDASVGYVLGSSAASADVQAWYVSQLTARGWQPATDNVAITIGIRSTAEFSSRAWRKRDFVFRFGIEDSSDPRIPRPEDGSRYETVYEIDLFASPPPPRPSPS